MSNTITGVAIKRQDGAIWALPKPARHGHLFALAALQGANPEPCVQGFMTDRGQFVDRITARAIAQVCDPALTVGPELYSEDLW